jgi:hypothetical protein
MLKKILLATAILLSSNLWANEPTDITICEANYSISLGKCDTLDESKQEVCFDKADLDYSICLDKVNAE